MKPYPFSAIVGHDQLRLALILCAVRPEIGGVLIRGEKGTAKSTAVRGLAALLSHGAESRLVELPIGATEDRVIGSLDLQRVLRDGEHAFSPGLLARAHGGVLYVDEVNLLHDHLVDLLLDAAAMGRVHIERDGISHSHEARFVLIGTMNPEEGELRPQLLDRFGLTVDVRASRDVEVRAQVIRQRMAYEADPDAFAERYAPADAELARRIAAARESVAAVVLGDNELRRIAALCAAFEVDGMRADLVVAAPRRRMPPGAVATPSTTTTSGWRPSWRCRTGAAAIRSTTPAWTATSSTPHWPRPATTTPSPSRIPPAVGRAPMMLHRKGNRCARRRNRRNQARRPRRRFAPGC
ncbi:hypothetical protein MYXE_32410 [Mycobacterium xenopi]|uniref:AAA+ ATPase domain-containing protein n=1 Tax=Mycobacterium xenopi TaxID=1789 RepID=A0AAD1M2I9_MYCXE|nr:hypothetical protein MYXE_32410 [Mycobacterium xenopi]